MSCEQVWGVQLQPTLHGLVHGASEDANVLGIRFPEFNEAARRSMAWWLCFDQYIVI